MRGQSITEFVVMLALLTALGVVIMKAFVGSSNGTGGATQAMWSNGSKKISEEPD